MTCEDRIKEIFFPLLQRNIKLRVNQKILRNGRLLLVNLKSNYISVHISTGRTTVKPYEIPYAYKYIVDNDLKKITLSYYLEDLCNGSQYMLSKLIEYGETVEKNNRLYNNELVIEYS